MVLRVKTEGLNNCLAQKIGDASDFTKDTLTEYVTGIVKKYFLGIPTAFPSVLLACS